MPKFKTLYERQMELATAQQPKPTITAGHTPIEIALGIDEQGRTTARKLYAFLELALSQYSRWCRSNITENDFAEENVDYEVLDINVENPKGGRPTQDYILTATFAKKLAMTSNTEKGEQAREYFIKVEERLKEVAIAMQKGFRVINIESLAYQDAMDEIRALKDLLTKERNTNNFLIGSVTKARGEDLNSVLLLTDKQAQARYSMSRAGIMKAASECNAVIRYGKRLRINREKMDEYLVKEYSE